MGGLILVMRGASARINQGRVEQMAAGKVVFLFDVDNTLLNNDRVTADLKHYLEDEVGHVRGEHYWTFFEEIRAGLGYADYLGALQRYRAEYPRDFHILTVSRYLLHYPFANRLYPNSIDAVDHCRGFGEAVILSDGDVVFQPLKIERSGLREAFDDKILIYIHKELELDDIVQRYPADHYVVIDDKVRILAAMKKAWGARVTTVFPRQGHYANDAQEVARYPVPDVTIERVGGLLEYDLAALLNAAAALK